ncbi:hypothetical protein C8J57DRAFT_1501492 [Mycena rebaudengoi]|nr:hypothetical protein C8J57DRAFT_1501492 [Mycena rebaudengoi]
MPEVSARSNSTWGALLHALLVFLGLFSAIVTAFLAESLSGLRPDEASRTNELLANLTDIMITLSGSLSLILSLSVAALAVTCRGFLNMVTLSCHAKATDKLIDIRMRWKEADKILGPVIEMIPQLLVIPVLLFVVGLLDNILSDVLQLAVHPVPVVATTNLSFFIIVGVPSWATPYLMVVFDHTENNAHGAILDVMAPCPSHWTINILLATPHISQRLNFI